jgi:glucosamine 6-phosphate synthetase-like amidotransferase/phosphosugar isomerase protein
MKDEKPYFELAWVDKGKLPELNAQGLASEKLNHGMIIGILAENMPIASIAGIMKINEDMAAECVRSWKEFKATYKKMKAEHQKKEKKIKCHIAHFADTLKTKGA